MTAATICFVLRHIAVHSHRLFQRQYTNDHTSSSSKTSCGSAGSNVSSMLGERATFFLSTMPRYDARHPLPVLPLAYCFALGIDGGFLPVVPDCMLSLLASERGRCRSHCTSIVDYHSDCVHWGQYLGCHIFRSCVYEFRWSSRVVLGNWVHQLFSVNLHKITYFYTTTNNEW